MKADLSHALLAAALLTLAACSGSKAQDPLSDAGVKGPPPQTSCTSNVDCQGGEICRGERCREACVSDQDCSDSNFPACSGDLGYCVQCVANEDCAGNEVCQSNLCEAGCANDSECQGGFACRDRRCVSLDPIICDAGAETCSGTTVVRCNADGTMEERVDCESGQVCMLQEGSPACVALVCTPNEIGCTNPTTASVCNDTGTELTSITCREGQFCSEGVCRNQVCEPGSQSCVGHQRVLCNADGSDFINEACADNCLSNNGCSCVDGACVERICTPGSGQCVATGLRMCNSNGTAWGQPEACPDVCVEGLCVQSTCTAGDTLCAGESLLTCNTLGTGYDTTDCTANGEVCDDSAGTAACVGQVCTPDSVRCTSDNTGLLVCNTLGTAETQANCAPGESCDRGVCLPDMCVPDCTGRTCGPDPICGQSCGPCAGTCTAGQCQVPTGGALEVSVSWTPSSVDLDLYMVKETGDACDAETCGVHSCQEDATRPDWDGSGGPSAGDPSITVSTMGGDPETIILPQPQLLEYIAAVHHDTPGGATANATIEFKLNGQVVQTHSQTLNPDDFWKALSIDLSQANPTVPPGTVDAGFTGCGAQTCSSDAECPVGTVCSLTIPSLPGTCVVGCRNDAECGSGLVCNGSNNCVSSVLQWGDACTDQADCAVGLYCGLLTQVCSEVCDTVGSCAGDPNCCPTSGALFCAQGLLFPTCSNTP